MFETSGKYGFKGLCLHSKGLKADSKAQSQKSILKTDPTSPAPGETKRVHFLENEELNLNSASATENNEHVGNNHQNAQIAVEVSANDLASGTPDKDSSTITIFNENSEVYSCFVHYKNWE